MRWREKVRPKHWETRIRSGFLFTPMWIHGEGRWLERARWREHFHAHDLAGFWVADEWLDDVFVVTEKGKEMLIGGE